MSYKISKELFEAVIERNDIEIFRLFKNEITFVFKDDWLQNNIKYNDFFFKCKEWLIGRGYDNWSGYHENEYFCYVKTKGTFISNSEQQSLFDACMYILDNKDKQ